MFAIWVGHFYAMKQKHQPQRHNIKCFFTLKYWRCWKLSRKLFNDAMPTFKSRIAFADSGTSRAIRGRLPRR